MEILLKFYSSKGDFLGFAEICVRFETIEIITEKQLFVIFCLRSWIIQTKRKKKFKFLNLTSCTYNDRTMIFLLTDLRLSGEEKFGS